MREAVLNSTLTTPVCGLNISHGYGIAVSAFVTDWIECFADYLSRM